MENRKVISLNISEKKGIVKKPVGQFLLNKDGVVGDAHAGMKNRQVSLLGQDSIDKFIEEMGKAINHGDFAENITIDHIPTTIAPLDIFSFDRIRLEVSQIGKHCHGTGCAIYTDTGNCIMPKEGIFCRVVEGGQLEVNDVLVYEPKVFDIRIITLSDRAHKGVYRDMSGETIQNMATAYMKEKRRECKLTKQIIPDEKDQLGALIKQWVADGADMIFTTGGTGIGPRDITPEVVRPLLDKELNGLMDYIRLKYGAQNPKALISRSVAGVIGKTLIYSLPGSVNGVKEYMTEILESLIHSSYMINDLDIH
ncbi:MAG: molybdopterin-binding protein [Bacteroidales bacterium]|nr:molybdopterin-binding protein [Bacteroidales bacterium]